MLHVTNGDAVIDGFRAGQVPGDYLAWRDPLHDGPVPEASSLEALSDIRARALTDFSWGSYGDIRSQFTARDRTLAGFRDHDEIVLWFEHDLYDQLQLLQLLDWLSRQDLAGVCLSVIQIGEHPDVPSFHGLGQLNGKQLASLLRDRLPVTQKHLALGREAWQAVCSPDPTSLINMAGRWDPVLPFLGPALSRLLEEYPSVTNGLSRAERQLLSAGVAGARHMRDYYQKSQTLETNPWGDASVFLRLEALAAGPHPALTRISNDELEVNEQGRQLLAGNEDWVGLSGGIDRWIGGVHLIGPDARWRWNERAGRLEVRG